jgi:hypothetical protein
MGDPVLLCLPGPSNRVAKYGATTNLVMQARFRLSYFCTPRIAAPRVTPDLASDPQFAHHCQGGGGTVGARHDRLNFHVLRILRENSRYPDHCNRSRETGPMQTMKIPNSIVRTGTSFRLFQGIISGRNSQPPPVARTLLSASCEPCPRHQQTRT